MRSIKGLLFMLLAIAVVFTFGQPAWAAFGSQGGATGSGGIVVDKDAPGTKYSGPLTIYYVPIEGSSNYELNFFLRLRKGWDLYGFSGTANDVPLDIPIVQGKIDDFIRNTVIPILYSNYTPYPEFWLKSVDQLVEDNDLELPGCCGGGFFSIMDVVISVQD